MDLLGVAARQAGVVSRGQALAQGLTSSQVTFRVRSGRWQTLLPGTYATFTGAADELARVWAAVLYAGTGAVAAGRTALWLARGVDHPGSRIEIAVPHGRKVHGQPGLVVRGRHRLEEMTHPAARPPRMRVEDAVLDVASSAASPAQVVDVLVVVTQRRLTTADRLLERLGTWPRHRWRSLVVAVLGDVRDGAQSVLEHRYLHGVERAHGLPRGERNVGVRDEGGGNRYHDIRYRRWRVVVELDGRPAHPDVERFRDRARDNRVVVSGETPLRYGWREVVDDPCGVASEVGAVLQARGWRGELRACGPGCGAVRGTA